MSTKSAKMVEKVKVGSLVGLQFLDHVEDSEFPLPCTAYGHVAKVDDLCIVLICWMAGDEMCLDDRNNKLFCVLKSTILNVNMLIPVPA